MHLRMPLGIDSYIAARHRARSYAGVSWKPRMLSDDFRDYTDFMGPGVSLVAFPPAHLVGFPWESLPMIFDGFGIHEGARGFDFK